MSWLLWNYYVKQLCLCNCGFFPSCRLAFFLVHRLFLTEPKSYRSLKCCLEILCGAFARRNDAAFLSLRGFLVLQLTVFALLTHCFQPHALPPGSSFAILTSVRHFGYMVPQCHCGKMNYCTVLGVWVALILIFTAASLLAYVMWGRRGGFGCCRENYQRPAW